MRLFEADTFEERIRAVENRAGRIAWEVMVSLQLLVFLYYLRVAGNEMSPIVLLLMLPILISSFIAWVIRGREGVTPDAHNSERLRIGRSSAVKKILRKRMIIQTGWGLCVAAVLIPWERLSLPLLLIAIIAVSLSLYFSDRVVRRQYIGSAHTTGQLEEEA